MNILLLVDIICTEVNTTLANSTGSEKINFIIERFRQLDLNLETNMSGCGFIFITQNGKRVSSVGVWQQQITRISL
jgi:hypothetical protein